MHKIISVTLLTSVTLTYVRVTHLGSVFCFFLNLFRNGSFSTALLFSLILWDCRCPGGRRRSSFLFSCPPSLPQCPPPSPHPCALTFLLRSEAKVCSISLSVLNRGVVMYPQTLVCWGGGGQSELNELNFSKTLSNTRPKQCLHKVHFSNHVVNYYCYC